MLEFFKDIAIGVNALVLIALAVKYAQDLRRHRLEYEKLSLEHQKLRHEILRIENDLQNKQKLILEATSDDIRRYVLKPLVEEIEAASRRSDEAMRHSMDQISDRWDRAQDEYLFRSGTADVPRLFDLLKEIKRLFETKEEEQRIMSEFVANLRDLNDAVRRFKGTG